MRFLTALIFTFLVMPSFSTALAGDFCITNGTFTIVGKAFKVPSKGKCKPFFGFFAPPNTVNATTGQACTSSDGSHVVFNLSSTASGSAGFAQWDNVDLSLPSLIGTQVSAADVSGVLTSGSNSVTGAPCSTVPIP